MTLSESDLAALARALREMRAAENSYRRALTEFNALLPQGVVLLHRMPDESDGPGQRYWAYERYGDGHTFGVETKEEAGTQAYIIVAPGPREEFLPRLS